jgi:hypothetical protein
MVMVGAKDWRKIGEASAKDDWMRVREGKCDGRRTTMAKVQRNTVIQGVTGALGDQLVARRDKAGRTTLMKKPTFSDDRVFSKAQKGQQGSFKEAMLYAKSAVKREPIYAEIAAGTPRTAYNVAISDWFHPPEVGEIDLSGWTGQVGESIRVKAVDDAVVARVMVTIVGERDVVIEQGDAEPIDDVWWEYVTRQPAPGQVSVIALAVDLPGHIAQGVARKL